MSTLVIVGGGGSGKTLHTKNIVANWLLDGGRVVVLTTTPDEWTPSEWVTVTSDLELVRELVTALIVFRQSAASPSSVLFVIDGADKFGVELTSALWQAVEMVVRLGRDAAVSFIATVQHTEGVVPRTIIDTTDVLVTGYPTAPREHTLFPLGVTIAAAVRDLFDQEATAVLVHRGSGAIIPWSLDTAAV